MGADGEREFVGEEVVGIGEFALQFFLVPRHIALMLFHGVDILEKEGVCLLLCGADSWDG